MRSSSIFLSQQQKPICKHKFFQVSKLSNCDICPWIVEENMEECIPLNVILQATDCHEFSISFQGQFMHYNKSVGQLITCRSYLRLLHLSIKIFKTELVLSRIDTTKITTVVHWHNLPTNNCSIPLKLLGWYSAPTE